MRKLFLIASLLFLSCTPTPPVGVEDAAGEAGDISGTDSGSDAGARLGPNLELQNTSEKLTSCYKMTVMVDRAQDVVCYILVSQCSSGVPSISCVKQ